MHPTTNPKKAWIATVVLALGLLALLALVPLADLLRTDARPAGPPYGSGSPTAASRPVGEPQAAIQASGPRSLQAEGMMEDGSAMVHVGAPQAGSDAALATGPVEVDVRDGLRDEVRMAPGIAQAGAEADLGPAHAEAGTDDVPTVPEARDEVRDTRDDVRDEVRDTRDGVLPSGPGSGPASGPAIGPVAPVMERPWGILHRVGDRIDGLVDVQVGAAAAGVAVEASEDGTSIAAERHVDRLGQDIDVQAAADVPRDVRGTEADLDAGIENGILEAHAGDDEAEVSADLGEAAIEARHDGDGTEACLDSDAANVSAEVPDRLRDSEVQADVDAPTRWTDTQADATASPDGARADIGQGAQAGAREAESDTAVTVAPRPLDAQGDHETTVNRPAANVSAGL